MKNIHLRRCPAASPSQRRAKKPLLIRRDAILVPRHCSVPVGAIHELPLRKNFGRPRERDFARLNLHLPACR
jgi:hypothetical protein